MKQMSMMQKLAWGYFALFVGVVALGYIPGFVDDQGLLFGSFKIDPVDDVLHLGSGLWAGWAAFKSTKASAFYFRAFGTFYTADAFLGFFTGFAFVDFATLNFTANQGYSIYNVTENFLVNLPHFIIGPIAMLIGFKFSKRFAD